MSSTLTLSAFLDQLKRNGTADANHRASLASTFSLSLFLSHGKSKQPGNWLAFLNQNMDIANVQSAVCQQLPHFTDSQYNG